MALLQVRPDSSQTTAEPPTPVLRLQDLSKSFPASNRPAVTQISLELQRGECLSLLGPSGCGKTTLLRLIAGFEAPTSGEIWLAGRPVTALPPEKRGVGMVFQDYALFPHLTVAENIAFGLKGRDRQGQPRSAQRSAQQSAQQRAQRIATVLQLVGLGDLEKRYPHQLSGGQQQRIALARALAPEPDIILLDEPLSNLDVQVRLHLRQELRDILRRANASAIFVTHDQEEALCLADRIAVMRAGRFEQIGTPLSIYQQPSSRFVAEFVTQANFLPAVPQGDGLWQTEMGLIPATQPAPPEYGGLAQGETQSEAQSEAHQAPAKAPDKVPVQADKAPAQPPAQPPVKSGETVPVPLASSREAIAIPMVMLRQEDLVLTPNEEGTAVIEDRQFLGREYRYVVRLGSGQSLIARQPLTIALSPGAKVQVSFQGETTVVFG